MRLLLLLVAGSLALSGTAADAGTYYRWETEDGGLAFADDPKRIPERYRAKADLIETEGLGSYERYTPTDPQAAQESAERLSERLEALRAASGEELGDEGVVVIEDPSAHNPVTGITLSAEQQTRRRRLVLGSDGTPRWESRRRQATVREVNPVLSLDVDPDSDEPVVVEEVQVRDREGFTRRATVTRQGDRILSVVKGPKHHFNPRDFVDEDDLER
jgi:hypothetical protein